MKSNISTVSDVYVCRSRGTLNINSSEMIFRDTGGNEIFLAHVPLRRIGYNSYDPNEVPYVKISSTDQYFVFIRFADWDDFGTKTWQNRDDFVRHVINNKLLSVH
jgi:hypothetical protein